MFFETCWEAAKAARGEGAPLPDLFLPLTHQVLYSRRRATRPRNSGRMARGGAAGPPGCRLTPPLHETAQREVRAQPPRRRPPDRFAEPDDARVVHVPKLTPEDKATAKSLEAHKELGPRTPIILGGHDHEVSASRS